MRYRRAQTNGGTYFFTVVTYKRTKFLCDSGNVSLLREEFKYVMAKHPFTIDAFVLLPDHLHCLWTLPDGDHDFSKRWRLIVRVTGCEFRVLYAKKGIAEDELDSRARYHL